MALIVAASCFRIFVCFHHNPMDYVFSDMQRHWNNGMRFPRGGYFGASDPIVYQVYMSALQHVTRHNRLLIALSSALMSVLMPWTYYRAARNFGLRKTAALWVWAVIAWAPSLLVIYHYIMMETLLLLLEGIALWMTARYLRRGGTWAFLLFVFFWTIAVLTKPLVAPLAGICFLWVWWKKSTPLREIAMGAALAALLVAPQAFRSKLELGFYAPLGNPWLTRIQLRSGTRMTYIHFYATSDQSAHFRHNVQQDEFGVGSPSGFIRPLEPFSHWAMRRAYANEESRVYIDAAHGERDWKDAYDRLSPDRDEWLAEWQENIILFFFAPSWPESAVGQWDGQLDYWSRWLWAPLILFVFAGNVREFVHRRFDLIPVAATLFTLIMALQNALIMEGRYRKPVETVLLMNVVWILARRSPSEGGKEKPLEAGDKETASIQT
ncbi:MAG TPA: phospholipid carrier-dependent glycosyltransferase [Candidatus Binatia bacterium]|nr:phospholipid carrier-dependent glycosyltransferase [Candidatus Binatia bacterium]